MQRRTFLKTALAGGGLTLPGLPHLREEILIDCHGGISHRDTWNPMLRWVRAFNPDDL